MFVLKQSTAVDVLIGPFVDSTDGDSEETGLTIANTDTKLSKNGQTLASRNDATSCAHDSQGMYNCELDATDTNTVGTLVIFVHVSGALAVRHEFQVVEEAVYDALFAASAAGPLQSTTAGRTLDVTATGAAGIDWGNVENQSTAVDLSGTDIQLCDTVTTNTDLVSAASIADAVLDEDMTAHQTTGTLGAAIGDPGANTETIYDAVVTDAAGTNVAADIVAVKAETALIVADTNELQTDWADAGRLDAILDSRMAEASINTTGGAVDTVTTVTNQNTTAAIADAVWDEDIVSSHTTIDTAGLILANTRGLAVGAGGISTVANSNSTVTTGSETLTYTSTQELDGTTHDIAPSVGSTDFYYEFSVGVTGVATEIIWEGHAESNGDSYTIEGYDWVSASWKTVGTIVATNNTTTVTEAFIFTRDMTGTGANAGVVQWRATSSDGTNISTDRILCEYTSIAESSGLILHSGVAQAGASNTITLDTGANATDDFYNHTRIVISSGTGQEQERLIVDYNGTTKVATIAPPWITTPDSTSAFEVEPGLAHAETGWATIKVGLAAAGASTTITLDSNASSTDDYYNNDLVYIDAGTGEGQLRVITDYNGTTKVATVHTAWAVTPDTTSEYVIEAGHPYTDAISSNIETDTQDIQSRLPSALVSGKMDSDTTSISGSATAADNLEASALGIVPGACEGTPTTTVIQTDLAETTDDHYIGRVVVFTSGGAAGQATDITDYTGSTGTITVTALTTAPSASDTFVIV